MNLDNTVSRMAGKFGQETPEAKADKESAAKAIAIYKYCLAGIRDKQYQWFLNDNAYFNRRTMKYNLATRTMEPMAQDGEQDRININKVKQIYRGVVSYLNREHPMIDIRPGTQSDQAYSKSRKQQSLAEYWYDHLQMNKKIKLITGHGAKYGIGWVKIAWDDQVLAPTEPFRTEDGVEHDKLKGEVLFEHCDTWEILADPLATDKGNMRFMVHAMPRTLSEIRNNKTFKNTDIAADRKLSVSPFKNALLNAQTINRLVPGDEGMETVMILEVFRRTYKDGQPIIMKTVITESGVLLYDAVWPMDEFPFEFYQTDVVSAIYDSEGVIKDIRDLNRFLNINASQVQETVRVMGKLNWLIPKGSGVNVIRDKTGDFIEYNPNMPKPEQAHPAAMAPQVENHNQNLERWIQDQGGSHDSFNGQQPYNRASGDAIGKLQEGDSNALAMMKDNLDDFEARCFKLMFKTFKLNADGDRHFRAKDSNVLSDAFVTVAPKEISLDDDIQVRTGTALPYSQGDKLKLVIDLWDKKLITDKGVAMRLAGLSEVDDVSGNDQLDIDRQTTELQTMIKGIQIDDPIISEDHSVHMRVLDQYAKTPDFKKLKPKTQQIILDHRAAHIKLSISLQKMSSSLQVEPIKRSETIMIRASSLNEFTPLERDQFMSKFAVESDATEIQKRGGLEVSDPHSAIDQAHGENTAMGEQGVPVHISAFDNHQVHLEVHNALVTAPEFEAMTSPQQNMVRAHIKQHEQLLMTQTPQAGLVPNGQNDDTVIPSHQLVTVADKRRMMRQAGKQ